MIQRKKTRPVRVKSVQIGGDAPIVIQSMTNTPTTDIDRTVAQIQTLAAAGCEIVRLAIPDAASAAAFKEIRKATAVPLVADIHFQYRFALDAIEAGVDKVRINPGNIGSYDRVKMVVDAAKAAHIPLRIGVNSGSVEKQLLEKHGGPTAQALAESCLSYVRMMEEMHFHDIVLSIKAADVLTTVAACRIVGDTCDYPQHIGITEAGTVRTGTVKSSVGLGILLSGGIGDTIRVSLSGDPLNEVYVAKQILLSLGLTQGPTVIACPTCGRTQIDVAGLAQAVEERLSSVTVPITVAVMGCIVNGPGEAREADCGIAGGKGKGVLFAGGRELEQVPENELLSRLFHYIDAVISKKTSP